jgi:protease-4
MQASWAQWAGWLVAAGLAALAALAIRAAVAAAARRMRARRGVVAIVGRGVRPEPVLDLLERAAADRRVRAVVLRIDSPGGAVGATQEIAEEIGRVRSAGKPVVASVGNVAASGGYWLAAQADRIVAPPGAILGSIGVLIAKPSLQRLLDRLGVEQQKVLSGPHKDLMAPDRPWDDEERSLLGDVNRAVFEQFIQAVAAGRRLEPEAVRHVADGRVFTASQARGLGLCDDVGNLKTALRTARALAGLPEWAPAVRLAPADRLPSLLRRFILSDP